MNYNGNIEKNKKTLNLIFGLTGAGILLIGFIIFKLISLSEIIILENTIEMSPGEARKIEYETKPKFRAKEEYIWTTNNEKAVSVNNGIVTAIGEGTATVWIKSAKKPEIFTTVVKTKKTRFKEKLIKNFGYTEGEDGKLIQDDKYIMDSNNKVFQYVDGTATYTYYYMLNYVYVINESSYERTEFRYILETKSLDCRSTGNSCEIRTLNETKEKIDLMLTYFKNYTVEDI